MHYVSLGLPKAIDVVTALVADNLSILTSLIDNEQYGLKYLLSFFRDHPSAINEKFLGLLAAFCSCGTKSVPKAQVIL